MPECENCGADDEAVMVNELHIVEYMGADGDIFKVDLSHDSANEELSTAKYIELAEWARIIGTAPIAAEVLHSYLHEFVYEEEDEDDDGETAIVTA